MDDKDYISLDDLDLQLSLDLNDNMIGGQAAQPALTISSASVDTITLGTGVMGASTYNYNYNHLSNLSPGITLTTGTGGSGSGSGGYLGVSGTGASGGYGQVLTTGTNGITWADLNQTQRGSLQVKGDADFDGDVKIKGKSLTEMFDKIEERLAILHPNPELEEKWDELRELRNRYKELEKEIIEKEKMWDILKK